MRLGKAVSWFRHKYNCKFCKICKYNKNTVANANITTNDGTTLLSEILSDYWLNDGGGYNIVL